MIPLDGHHVRLTVVAGGVRLDIDGDGVRDRVAVTVAGTRAGFLLFTRMLKVAVPISLGEFQRATVARKQR